jgi:hypothetical protein
MVQDPGAPDDRTNPSASSLETEGPLPPGSHTSLGATPDRQRRRTHRSCELCQQADPTALAAIGVGVLLAITAGQFANARFLLSGLCQPHIDGATTTALTSARLLDTGLRELAARFPILDNFDGDELPRELARRLALDLARHSHDDDGRTLP